MSVIGIDFGTQNITIAAAQKGGIDVLLNEVSSRQTPCMASFGEKERALGEPALTQFARNTKNTVINVKRLLGRNFDEEEMQEEIKSLPFKTNKNAAGEVGINVTYANQKREFDPTTVAAMILGKVKQIAEKATEKPCKDVVISVPGWWTVAQRQALLDASRIAGVNALKLISDHAASALQYGIYKTNLSETEPLNVVIIDVGYSGTSVSVVEFMKGKLRVVSTAYDRNLGGRDFDRVLVDHFVKEFSTKYKIDIRSNEKALIRLEVACEKLKKVLNTVPEAPINIDSLMNDIDVRGMMKRADFDAMSASLLDRLMEVVNKAITDSKIPTDKMFAVEITGGCTRLLAVQTRLAEGLKRDISKTLNQEESVARGCALQCAILSPIFKVREFNLVDVQPYPIRVTWEKATPAEDNVLELFPVDSTIPSAKILTVCGHESLDLTAEYADVSLLPKGSSTVIGRYTVKKINPTKKETSKLRLKIKLDQHGILVAESATLVEDLAEEKAEESTKMDVVKEAAPAEGTATEGAEKKEEKKEKKKVKRTDVPIQFESGPALSTKQLNDMTELEIKMASDDRLSQETAERKNAVETYIYDMRSKISESLASFTTEAVATSFSKQLEDAESWLYEDGAEQTKSVYVKKLEELKTVGDPIAKRRYESENRYEAISSLRSTVQNFRLLATSEDPKYEHIDKSEKSKILDECDSVEKTANDAFNKQEQQPKHTDATFTVADILKKKADLERLANGILSKPKPAPPKEEKKPEAPKSEGETKEGTAEGQPAQDTTPAAEEKKPAADMDLD
ncbi:hypothetical protein PROFUN_12619 [Planoprotostelium fungivorum]|uniref:Heat shock protein 70 n=1 Tax=Planoprotostelium fungivorum TaxID=1890364 RepID=A0A2P6N745_9EUKA|nr:hypothetical protein PROFUN_12619 [Planoprotostelium fungivorum]